MDQMWEQKYTLRVAMLPAFIPRHLADRILIIGKSLDFLRHVCKDRESFNQAEMAARRLDAPPQSDGSCEYLLSAAVSCRCRDGFSGQHLPRYLAAARRV